VIATPGQLAILTPAHPANTPSGAYSKKYSVFAFSGFNSPNITAEDALTNDTLGAPTIPGGAKGVANDTVLLVNNSGETIFSS
jgi:hypothetical protein